VIQLASGEVRSAWLEARTTGIGASESVCLLGLPGAWGSPLRVWRAKVHPEADDREETERLAIGRALEETILGLVAQRAGVLARPNRALYAHDEIRHLIATPDGFGATEGRPFGVEIKNVSEWAGRTWDDVPAPYLCQCQHGMLVTGYSLWLFGALVGGNRVVWRWVTEDLAFQIRIRRACAELWARVKRGEPPPATEGDAPGVLAGIVREGDAGEIDGASELDRWLDLRGQESRLKAELKSIEAKRKAVETDLAAKLGENSSGTIGNHRLGWRYTVRNGYVVQPTAIQAFEIKEIKS
jgi:putative phage-type endonuclease